MTFVVQSYELLQNGVRFSFRSPQEKYTLGLHTGASFTGLAAINLLLEGQIVAAYQGHDELARKKPKVSFVGQRDERDLEDFLKAARGYAFGRLYAEQFDGPGNGPAAKMWHVISAAVYDEGILRYLYIESGKNQRYSSRVSS